MSLDICRPAKSKWDLFVNVLFVVRLEAQSRWEVSRSFSPCQSSSGFHGRRGEVTAMEFRTSLPTALPHSWLYSLTMISRYNLSNRMPGDYWPNLRSLGSEKVGEVTLCVSHVGESSRVIHTTHFWTLKPKTTVDHFSFTSKDLLRYQLTIRHINGRKVFIHLLLLCTQGESQNNYQYPSGAHMLIYATSEGKGGRKCGWF